MSGERERLEPWAWPAFGVGLATLSSYLVLGSRPGGALGPWLYRQGSALLFLAAGGLLAGALVWAVTHRPVLGRRRLVPFAVLALSVAAISHPLPYPSSHEGHPPPVAFRLPFDGAWRVLWGGERRADNPLVLSPARRFGYELVPLDPADGERVLAPAAGTVVAAVGDLPDEAGPEPFGNHVVLEVAPATFLVLGNLRRESLAVRPGERVEAGALVGALGDSAAGSWRATPQLMVHLQDEPEPGRGEGIPLRFGDYEAAGRRVEVGVPTGGLDAEGPRGQVVRPAPPR